jgi:hypothetical protein
MDLRCVRAARRDRISTLLGGRGAMGDRVWPMRQFCGTRVGAESFGAPLQAKTDAEAAAAAARDETTRLRS